MTPQFPPEPDRYGDRIRAAVPRYDELQDRAVEAIPLVPGRVLELGIGTGETTRRLRAAFPDAAVTGLDSSPEMVFKARELGIDVRLARMEDPLPDGPWDLVVAVLAIHNLDDAGKRDLFRRVRGQSRSLVIADVVEQAPLEAIGTASRPAVPAARLAQWCDGEVAWEESGVAVVRALYD